MPTLGRWFALGLTTVLVACAGTPQQQSAPATAPEPAAETAAPAVVAVVEVPPAPEPAPVPDLKDFMNQTGIEIAGLLGDPGFVRRDPPAELWQYRASECTLDLFLYDDGYGDYRLTHFDFRGATFTDAARDDCLRDILGLSTS